MRNFLGLILALAMLTGVALAAQGTDTPDPQQAETDRTPPRLSFADGQTSFWRPGSQDWAQAQVNTPLSPGDELATGSPGNLEIQVGSRTFVRAWASTQIGLENQEPDFIQFKVTAGHVSFDLRTLEPGHTVEVDTPNAALTIEHTGYYRVDVTGERTSFIARRGGRAAVTPASGEAFAVSPSEEVVIEGTSSPQTASFAAPPLDTWDKWNYARTDALLDAVSARYVSPGTYGVNELDLYGTWRVVPTYGSVWVPTALSSGWVPYSTGTWVLDPFYGWTWVDTAPWGWAPYHYGRWVFVDGFWAWAPGPVVRRAVYAPALVAFFGGPGVRVGVGIGGPVVGWVALGWGEPLVPWWGRAGFVHVPTWRGWHGPRVVNNVIVSNTTVVNVEHLTVYRNTSVRNSVVVVNENRFGHGPIMASTRVAQVEVKNLQVMHAAPQVAAVPASFVPTASRGIRPPEEHLRRSVVATRAPHAWSDSASGAEAKAGPAGIPRPAPRLVSVPRQGETALAPRRPPFGQSPVERSPAADRARPPAPPRPEVVRRPEQAPDGAAPTTRAAPREPRREAPVTGPSPTAPQQPPGQRAERSRRPARPLPGEAANRLAPDRGEKKAPQRREREDRPGRPHGPPENTPRERPGG